MHDSYYSDNDIDRILYQYYKANGGCLMGIRMRGSILIASCSWIWIPLRCLWLLLLPPVQDTATA